MFPQQVQGWKNGLICGPFWVTARLPQHENESVLAAALVALATVHI
jgi:hypothetical protein